MALRSTHLWLFLCAAAACACEDPPKLARALDASADAPPPPPPPAREGCARVGSMGAIASDPSCVVRRIPEDAMRASLKNLSLSLTAEPLEVVGGGTALMAVAIKNVSSVETTLYFEARPRPAGPRTDWSRVAGIPEPHPAVAETPHLLFPMTTTDSRDRDVDALPTVAGSAPAPVDATALAVHLRPGGKLTHVMSWWALRIPAPAPVVTDDAGHRYTPKTTAQNLFPGEYTVTVDLPLAGLSREERKVTARVKVTRTPLPDGGFRRLY